MTMENTSAEHQPAAAPAGNVPRRLVLGASCTIEDVAQLRNELLAHLDANKPVIIDATRLERIDAAGVQLLAAFAIDCLERGTAFAWKPRPAVLEEAIRLLGLGALMESPGEVLDIEGAA